LRSRAAASNVFDTIVFSMPTGAGGICYWSSSENKEKTVRFSFDLIVSLISIVVGMLIEFKPRREAERTHNKSLVP
jgi:hypothetical protein